MRANSLITGLYFLLAQCLLFLIVYGLYFFLGWITVLSEWVNHEDVRVSIPAAKTLVNFDLDNEHEYSSTLYLLSPLKRTTKDREVDVVFVHGLLGGVFFTWRQRGRDSNVVGFMGKKNQKGTNLFEIS